MKLLVLGASGMAGSMMFKYLSKHYDTTAWFREDFDPIKDPIPDLSQYDYVINCIGLIKQKSNGNDDELMYKINSDFPQRLANKHNRVIHISSDCVFSGDLPEDKAYKRTDVPDAKDAYGKSKAQGEVKNAMVLRTSIIGPSKDNFGLFEWFRDNQQAAVQGYTNHWWSGITTLELAMAVDTIIKYNLYKHKLWQLASQKISKFDLLCLINQVFSLNKNIVPHQDGQTINRVLVSNINIRPLNTQLQDLKIFME